MECHLKTGNFGKNLRKQTSFKIKFPFRIQLGARVLILKSNISPSSIEQGSVILHIAKEITIYNALSQNLCLPVFKAFKLSRVVPGSVVSRVLHWGQLSGCEGAALPSGSDSDGIRGDC